MSIYNSLRIFFTFICLVFSAASDVYAAGDGTTAEDNAIASTLCNVVNALTGPIGRGIATIAIIALAIGLFLGKLSWGLAMATGIGVGMVFGAKTIVSWLSDQPGSTKVTAESVCKPT